MELQNEELEKLYEESFHGIRPGTVLTGRVLSIRTDRVIVDVGSKSEGIVDGSEFSQDELQALKTGDDMEVFVVSAHDSEGMVVLSKSRALKIKSWDSIEACFKEDGYTEGTVVEKTKGGVFVDVCGIKAFMPASHMDIRPVRDMDSYLGRHTKVKILKLNNRRSNIIVSSRLYLEQQRSKMKAEIIDVLKEGDSVKGIVKNITDYGVFVDLGGIDGLLHISDISWGRIAHPSKYFHQGQELEVIILSFDREHEKITLGYKQKTADPWLTVEEKYPIGTRVSGKVVSLTDYGAFVEVEDALEGLVHASEIDWASRPKHPSKYLSLGDIVEAVVIRVDKNDRKLSLSLKQIKPSPWQVISEKYNVGQKINGKVRGLTDFGAFIGLPEGIDGLVHISDMSWTKHVKHPSELLKKGQNIDAVILSIEPDKERLALGIKQLTEDPWVSYIPQNLALGEEVRCKVLRKTEFGIFIELQGGMEGLIYSSETADSEGKIEEGAEIIARIIKIDLENKKIGLSMRNVKGSIED